MATGAEDSSCKRCGQPNTFHTDIPPSPTPHLYRSLASPYPSEQAAIREVLSTYRCLLRCFDEQLCSSQQDYSDLLDGRDRLWHAITAHQSFLAPIRRIPQDVLLEIFSAAHDDTEHDILRHEGSRVVYATLGGLDDTEAKEFLKKSPWKQGMTLSHVCIGWREAALNMQKFWCQMSNTLHPECISTFLSRCTTVALSVDLHYYLQSTSTYWRSMDLTIDASDRWRTLAIDVKFLDLHNFVNRMNRIRNRMNRLEELHLEYTYSFDSNTDVFRIVPRLQTLSIFHAEDVPPSDVESLPDQMRLPWDQIRQFSMRSDSLDVVMAVLRPIPNLTNFWLRFVSAYSMPSHMVPSVQRLPHLVSFHCTIMPGSNDLLDALELPAAQEITLVAFDVSQLQYYRGQHVGQWPDEDKLTTFLAHLSSSLRS